MSDTHRREPVEPTRPPESSARVLILSGYGINAERELADAFAEAGGAPEVRHVSDVVANPEVIADYAIVGFPGGFSFGDHLGSGKALAAIIRAHLLPALSGLVARGGLIIGICNGFQVLVKSGLLPNTAGDARQEVTLVHNDSGRFINRWVRCAVNPAASAAWLAGLDQIDLPIRHGEGRFLFGDEEIRSRLQQTNCIALRYVGGNPNGSQDNVAGICDPTGRILGLMPHPEAFRANHHHPHWTRGPVSGPTGLTIFQNGVRAAGKLHTSANL
ncbi:MAG: phosphoribosylformylglycinamidine synthase subunit PurQ [Spirochaetaceae bacterium]|nr:MAG: phosphoribosylformylglycinamidine synthase subunit PurQ [Spirochaetaceae bacterium]